MPRMGEGGLCDDVGDENVLGSASYGQLIGVTMLHTGKGNGDDDS